MNRSRLDSTTPAQATANTACGLTPEEASFAVDPPCRARRSRVIEVSCVMISTAKD